MRIRAPRASEIRILITHQAFGLRLVQAAVLIGFFDGKTGNQCSDGSMRKSAHFRFLPFDRLMVPIAGSYIVILRSADGV